MNFSSMKVGSRLALGFSTLIVIGIVVAVFGRIQLERLADEVQLLVDDRMVKVEQITEAINNINLIARAVRNIALTSDYQEMEKEKKRIDEARAHAAIDRIEAAAGLHLAGFHAYTGSNCLAAGPIAENFAKNRRQGALSGSSSALGPNSARRR